MSKILSYPSNLGDIGENPGIIQFEFIRPQNANSKNDKTEATVQLFMPMSIMQPSTVTWGGVELGFMGDRALGYQTRNPDSTGLGTFIEQSLSNIAGRSEAIAYTSVLNLLGNNLSADDFASAANKATLNPYLSMMFKKIDFRSFGFSFNLTAFSEDEAETIHEIIKTFRMNSLPEQTTDGIKFKYPSYCQITYLWEGKPNRFLHKFKLAACVTLDVNYSKSGMFSTFRNGMPSTITLNTGWSEIELVTKDDVEDGF